MTQTPIPPGIIRRATAAARYVISGAAPGDWFGPLQPLPPMAPPDVAGRRFDYPTGYNLASLPRTQEAVTFEELRALADNCDILRSVIETRKDQMEALDWAVRVAPPLSRNTSALPGADQARRIAQVTAFLRCPDKERGFAQWLRQILEDMFVIDAAALYKRTAASGELYALEIVDGATIKILIDESGRLPAAPGPAYQQVLKGVPAADYTRDELMYLMHNPRSHKIYGYSHVEQVLVTVNILIRRAMHQLEFYREGSQPDALVGLPKEWNQDQIATFQKSFDAMYSGNLAQRRHVRFMPGEFRYQETKPPPLKDAYDEFLARIICYVFSISPEPFVGQINRATAQTSHARAIDEGLAPLMRFVSGFMNRIIAADFASPDLEFVWLDAREQDPAEAAQIDVAYVGAGILTVDEVRQNMGLLPLAQVLHPLPGAGMVVADVKKNSSARPLRAHIRKFNPYHLGPGQGGGQFTTAGMGGVSDGLPQASGAAVRAQAASPGPADDAIDSDPIGGLLLPAVAAFGGMELLGAEAAAAAASRGAAALGADGAATGTTETAESTTSAAGADAVSAIANDLNEAQLQNLDRFNTKLPANAGSTNVSTLWNGNTLFQADVPADNIPNSFARYEKIVDENGNTVQYTKTTYAADGSVVHTKVKFP